MLNFELRKSLKPKYLIEDLKENLEEKKVNSVEKAVLTCFVDILNDSERFLFHSFFENYVFEFEDLKFSEKNNYSDMFKNIGGNTTIEYFDMYNNQDVLLNILDSKHPLFKKLTNLLGQSNKIKSNKNAKLLLFFFKEEDEDDWQIPVETIFIDDKNNYDTLKLFPARSFNLANSLENKDQKDSFTSFFEGLFDIFKSILFFFRGDIEYIYVPPLYDKKGNVGYLYKVYQCFTKPPSINLKENPEFSVKLKEKYKIMKRNSNKIKNNLYLD